MDELRNQIWDYLFRTQSPQTLSEIATQTNLDLDTVMRLVDHPWFDLANDRVQIAYEDQSH